jgi:hypothetical protein
MKFHFWTKSLVYTGVARPMVDKQDDSTGVLAIDKVSSLLSKHSKNAANVPDASRHFGFKDRRLNNKRTLSKTCSMFEWVLTLSVSSMETAMLVKICKGL